jgi:hypothetical protein
VLDAKLVFYKSCDLLLRSRLLHEKLLRGGAHESGQPAHDTVSCGSVLLSGYPSPSHSGPDNVVEYLVAREENLRELLLGVLLGESDHPFVLRACLAWVNGDSSVNGDSFVGEPNHISAVNEDTASRVCQPCTVRSLVLSTQGGPEQRSAGRMFFGTLASWAHLIWKQR